MQDDRPQLIMRYSFNMPEVLEEIQKAGEILMNFQTEDFGPEADPTTRFRYLVASSKGRIQFGSPEVPAKPSC